MESFNVNKEFILEAHKEACNSWKKKIEEKFPEAFRDMKVSAIKEGTYNRGRSEKLLDFCNEAFDDGSVIQIAHGATPDNRPELRSRALYVSSLYVVEVIKANDDGNIIVIKKV